jgi:hypothetical protein
MPSFMSAFIDINDDHEVYIWARTFGVTPDELVRLVSEIGPSVEHIRDALKRDQIARTGGRRYGDETKRRQS